MKFVYDPRYAKGVEEGKHRATIDEAENHTSKAGNKSLRLGMKLKEGGYITTYYSFLPRNATRLGYLKKALGLPEDCDIAQRTEEIVGKQVEIDVVLVWDDFHSQEMPKVRYVSAPKSERKKREWGWEAAF